MGNASDSSVNAMNKKQAVRNMVLGVILLLITVAMGGLAIVSILQGISLPR